MLSIVYAGAWVHYKIGVILFYCLSDHQGKMPYINEWIGLRTEISWDIMDDVRRMIYVPALKPCYMPTSESYGFLNVGTVQTTDVQEKSVWQLNGPYAVKMTSSHFYFVTLLYVLNWTGMIVLHCKLTWRDIFRHSRDRLSVETNAHQLFIADIRRSMSSASIIPP